MNMETVSVIIPTYNREKTIKRAIESALNQTFSLLEVLVCDDGSTDKSREIVEKIKDARVEWLEGKHSGLPAVARNRGIKKSKGKWIAFLDSDDWWEKDKLQKQLKLAETTHFGVVCSNAYTIKPDSKHRPYFNKSEVDYKIGFSDLIKANLVICSSVLVEKKLIYECGGFPEEFVMRAVEDYALWLRVATKSKFGYCNEPLLNYTDEPKSSLRYAQLKLKLNYKVVLQNFLKWSFKESINDNKQIPYIIKSLIKYIGWF